MSWLWFWTFLYSMTHTLSRRGLSTLFRSLSWTFILDLLSKVYYWYFYKFLVYLDDSKFFVISFYFWVTYLIGRLIYSDLSLNYLNFYPVFIKSLTSNLSISFCFVLSTLSFVSDFTIRYRVMKELFFMVVLCPSYPV